MTELGKMDHPGRLAFRVEGNDWVCYWAALGTMTGAQPLASIKMHLVEDRQCKDAFIALMRKCFADLAKRVTGADFTWPEEPQTAPEHERAGRG
jgi:hypothetical protein